MKQTPEKNKPVSEQSNPTLSMKRAMILAAGLGTRLLPITESVPKPLVPVLNIPNILYCVFLLKRLGVREICINVHHLADKMTAFLGDGSQWGVSIHYSKESLLLGTGGGLKKAADFFTQGTFVLVNCDFITNADLKAVLEVHRGSRSLATMALWENSKVQAFYGKVGVDSTGHLCSLPTFQRAEAARTGIFTGVHFLEPEVLQLLEEVPSGINQVMYPKLMKDQPERVGGVFLESAYWHDTGDLPHLFSTSMALLRHLHKGDGPLREILKTMAGYEEKKPGIWGPVEAKLDPKVTFEAPVIFGKNCTFGDRAVLGPFAVIGDKSEIGSEAHLTHYVGLESSRVPSHEICKAMIQFQDLKIPMSEFDSGSI